MEACRGDEVNDGAWHALSESGHARWLHEAPPCCGWVTRGHANDDRYCPGAAHSEQMSHEFMSCRGAQQSRLTMSGGNACVCNMRNRSTALSKRWVPKKCSLRLWDAEMFCAALGNRSLLFIGDSTMQQVASVVMNSVAWDERSRRVALRCQENIYFGHSDTLVNRTLGRANRGRHWLSWMETIHPDIVVLGATAHVWGFDNFEALLREVIAGASALPPHVTVMWQTSTPGGCGPTSSSRLPPLNHARDSITCNSSTTRNARCMVHGVSYSYNWGDFLPRDRFAKHVLLGQRLKVLDLEPLHYRVDGHVNKDVGYQDCLHMCIPGPLSFVPRLLMHRLLHG
jgi:hypothetical protein